MKITPRFHHFKNPIDKYNRMKTGETNSTTRWGRKKEKRNLNTDGMHTTWTRHITQECNNVNKDCSSTLSLSREADRANFHWGCHHQWSFWRVTNSIFVVHETTLNNGLILQQNLVTITAFKALLIPVAVVSSVLHLLEVPYHTELAHRCH